MPLERWGSFSVADHLDTAALAVNVLLYDRLIIPVMAEQADRDERGYWIAQGWNPDLQNKRVEQLQQLAIRRPWDSARRDIYRHRLAELKAERHDAAGIDHQHLTRMVLAQEQVIEKIPGVHGVSVIAAYNSQASLESDFSIRELGDNMAAQAYLLTRRLAVPETMDVETALKDAIILSRDPAFRTKRAALFSWQEEIALRGYSPQAAVNYVSELTDNYNTAVKDAFGTTRWRLAFMACGIGLGFAGGGIALATASAAISLIEFSMLDRKPAIEAGTAEPAAMFHDIESRVGLTLQKE